MTSKKTTPQNSGQAIKVYFLFHGALKFNFQKILTNNKDPIIKLIIINELVTSKKFS